MSPRTIAFLILLACVVLSTPAVGSTASNRDVTPASLSFDPWESVPWSKDFVLNRMFSDRERESSLKVTDRRLLDSGTNSLVAALLSPDGPTQIEITGVVVTAVFPGCFYIQDLDRVQALRVLEPTEPEVVVGDLVDVSGTMSTSIYQGEREIQATDVTITGIVAPPRPLVVRTCEVSGGDWEYNSETGAGKMGATGTYDINNIGKLVQVSGVVTYVAGDGYFYMDDGFALDDGSGLGLKVIVDYGVPPVSLGDYVTVTGLSSLVWAFPPTGALHTRNNYDIEVMNDHLADTQITVYPGLNWISLQRMPLHPDPVSVFDGIDIDWKLWRWDLSHLAWVPYDALDPPQFGNVATGQGYILNVTDGHTHTVSYSGLRALSDFMVSVPLAGDFRFGAPYIYPVLWENLKVTNGHQIKSVQAAIAAGWLGAYWCTWDPVAQEESPIDPSHPELSTAWLMPGLAYKATSLVGGLGIIIPAPPDGIWGDPVSSSWSDPANWLSGSPPSPDSPVNIQAPGNYTVTVDAGAGTVGSLTLGAGNAEQTQRVLVPETLTLDVNADVGIVQGGCLDLQGGVVAVGGDFTNGGTLSLLISGGPGPFSKLKGGLVGTDAGALCNITGALVTTGTGNLNATYKGVPSSAPISVGGQIHPSGSLVMSLDPSFTMSSQTSFRLMQSTYSTDGIVGDFDPVKKTYPPVAGLAWNTQKSKESNAWMYRINAAQTPPAPDNIASIRGAPGTGKTIQGIVTAKFPDYIYVESSDRSSGARVIANSTQQTYVGIGDRVWFAGDTEVAGGQKQIKNPTPFVVLSSGNALPYLGMRTRDIGGHAYGANDPGVTNGLGALNVGLLLKIHGIVTYRDTAASPAFFYIWDGANYTDSPVYDGNAYGAWGIRIANTGSGSMAPWTSWVEVEGVVSVNQTAVGGKTIPEILPSVAPKILVAGDFTTVTSPTGTVRVGKNLIGVPVTPGNVGDGDEGGFLQPYDPAKVIPSTAHDTWEERAGEIDYRLTRWDSTRRGSPTFDMSAEPHGEFGGIVLGDGYWYNSLSAYNISYKARVQDIPQWISPGGVGKVLISCPQNHDVKLDPVCYEQDWTTGVMMSDGGQVMSFYDASSYGAGWINSTGIYWDNVGRGSRDVGVCDDGAYEDTLHPWRGYWFTWLQSYKSMIVP